jgi:hypothetical protein
VIGFIAGFTFDAAVYRKLVETEAVAVKKS